MEKIEIKEVLNKKDFSVFIDLPWEIYKGDSVWVPPLKEAVKGDLDVEKNPFYKNAKRRLFLAYKDGKAVGRIAAILNNRHNSFHNEKILFWGFFECINDNEVSKLLFDEVEKWARALGMDSIRGPCSPSTNHAIGMLIDGYEDSPFIMMTYNPKYYNDLCENTGHTKIKDLYAYIIDQKTNFKGKMDSHASKMKRTDGIRVRKINMKDWDNEIDKLLVVYNESWEKMWGFVPMTDEEFKHMAKEMKMLLYPPLVLVVEVNGEIAGFALTLPDVHQIFKTIKDGELLPTGLVKLLWHLKLKPYLIGKLSLYQRFGIRPLITRARILALGVRPKFRSLGLGPIMYTELIRRAPFVGVEQGEMSWVLEDNIPMNQAAQNMNGVLYKKYRIYQREVRQ